MKDSSMKRTDSSMKRNDSNPSSEKKDSSMKRKDSSTKMNDSNPSPEKKDSRYLNAMECLSKMKKAKVLCLGSWAGSAKSHIEVESTEFFKGLTSMKELMFLSLQGISRISKLPSSIGTLSNLLILDLKECHNLEDLSEEIAKLKNLRYLDVSDCHLLAGMPKGLSALLELQVLKGFLISNPENKRSGTLDELKGLKKLRKLAIIATSKQFPTRDDLQALHEIGQNGQLRKLTIAWDWGVPKTEDQNGQAAKSTGSGSQTMEKGVADMTEKLLETLVKLDLQCFPKTTSTWLTPENLPNIKKLYIRGGNLETLNPDKNKWPKVDSLRLKFLRELKMTWIELVNSFPNLEYLEKVKCPRISLCPCDENGVWMKPADNDHIV
uniref:Disease resistance R13L4/SHOC-2-like LRR domain-containing protein n=1 Tax=Fagus sylvatica TaxID=28930 RepID=A0A2N9I2S3_FAGSY